MTYEEKTMIDIDKIRNYCGETKCKDCQLKQFCDSNLQLAPWDWIIEELDSE